MLLFFDKHLFNQELETLPEEIKKMAKKDSRFDDAIKSGKLIDQEILFTGREDGEHGRMFLLCYIQELFGYRV